MKITSINEPLKCCTQRWGTARAGHKNYEFFYEPRRRFAMRDHADRNPHCWMNIEPPDGARQIVLKAVRGGGAWTA